MPSMIVEILHSIITFCNKIERDKVTKIVTRLARKIVERQHRLK